MEIGQNEFNDFIIRSFRYALQYESSSASSIPGYIIKHKNFISGNVKEIISREIRRAVLHGSAGSYDDGDIWLKVAEELFPKNS